MKIDKNGLAYRVLLPVFSLVAGVTVALLLLVFWIFVQVREDYYRFTIDAADGPVTSTLNLAAAELTAAKLSDNPVVAEAKQRSVLVALANYWTHGGLQGIVSGPGGTLVLSTFDGPTTRALIARREEGYYSQSTPQGRYHLSAHEFPPWGWTVTTGTRHDDTLFVRKELLLLLPLVAAGTFALAAGLFVVLWRNLRRPVLGMITALEQEQALPPTGIAEFDGIGRAVNVALARVREREGHIRLLLDSTAEGIYGVDTAGVCTFCNPACLRLVGAAREDDLLGKNVHALIHHTRPDGTPYPDSECRIFQAYRERRGVHVDDEVFWRLDGSRFPVEYWSHPIVEGETVTGAVVAFIDITERRRSAEFIRNILETVDEGFMVVDRDRRIVLANRALGVLVNAPLEQIRGRTCHEIFHQRETPCTDGQPCLLNEVFATGKAAAGQHTHRRAGDGHHEVRVELRAYPVLDETGTVTSAIMTLTDVTEKAGLEQQLRQAQKMEAIGRLAGGIAHDFNNMLMAIVGYASLGSELAPEGSELRLYNNQVLSAAEKATDLTRQILAFSRKQVMSTAPVDLNGIILGMHKIIARLLGEDVEFSLNLTGSELVVMADRGQIEQVLMNLCTNARDAMPAGGRLIIGSQTVGFDQEGVDAHGLEQGGPHALITVSDTGAGIDEQTRLKIFEPFFTTKELGKGTGLGLSIVYGIVKQHHGQISVYSEPGHGTTFRIYLPLTAKAAVTLGTEQPVEVRGGSEMVLMAEDNEDVRALAARVLGAAGYRVVEAKDGEEAVRLFAEHAEEVALCLFDVVMPRLSGKDALEQIRRIRPAVRAVYMSGYAADLLGGPALLGPDVQLISKPLLPRELLRKVREALDA